MSNWLTEAITREARYDEGYEAGKAAAVDQIFEEFEEWVAERLEAIRKKRADFADSTDLSIYWTARGTSYGEMLETIKLLKKKYQEEL